MQRTAKKKTAKRKASKKKASKKKTAKRKVPVPSKPEIPKEESLQVANVDTEVAEEEPLSPPVSKPLAQPPKPKLDQMPPEPTAPDLDAPIRWRKTAKSGTFRMPGKIIKPGQTFTARPSQIPMAFRDTIKPLDPLLKKEDKPVVSSTAYRMEFWSEEKDIAFYNVVQVASGKAINDSPLPQPEAEKLMRDLS